MMEQGDIVKVKAKGALGVVVPKQFTGDRLITVKTFRGETVSAESSAFVVLSKSDADAIRRTFGLGQ